MLWDCKVTPAYCACQEGNTIGCISSNDGLGAGVVDLFSTEEQWSVISGQWSVAKREQNQRLFTTEFTGFHGVQPSGAKAQFLSHVLRGAEAPLFHGTGGISTVTLTLE
jgi:hypothetical protein